jgi:hypothetical protein
MATRTPEQKTRMAEKQRERYANPEYRAHQIEYERKRLAEDPERRARQRELSRQRWGNPEYRATQTEKKRERRYGLTPEQYAAMLEAQGGLCAICRGKGGIKGFMVDHCHETGVVRGLLCPSCNAGMGMLGDTPAGLMRAVKYLREARKRQQLPLLETED